MSIEHEKHLKNIEKHTGMSIQEIQIASPEESRARFRKNLFEGLNPYDYRDARKILRKYKTIEKNYLGFAPREVIDSDLTVYIFKKSKKAA